MFRKFVLGLSVFVALFTLATPAEAVTKRTPWVNVTGSQLRLCGQATTFSVTSNAPGRFAYFQTNDSMMRPWYNLTGKTLDSRGSAKFTVSAYPARYRVFIPANLNENAAYSRIVYIFVNDVNCW